MQRVQPRQHYKMRLTARNCHLSSPPATITVAASSVPGAPGKPVVLRYASDSEMTIGWEAPAVTQNFPVEKYSVYLDGSKEVDLNPSQNTFTFKELTFGMNLKVQISASNLVGESNLSLSVNFVFANVPTKPASLELVATDKSLKA